MAQRLLFVIRGKLGDTLVAFAALQAYRSLHPGDRITLLVRRNYLPLIEREVGVRLVGFGSRLEMISKLLWLRLKGARFDALAVLWGFGKPLIWIARLAPARRRIGLDGNLAAWYPEFPAPEPDQAQVDPAWRVLRLLDPQLARPAQLLLPGLASLRRNPGVAIGVVPFADEARRNMDTSTLLALLHALAAKHPGAPLWVLVNPEEQSRLEAKLPDGAEFIEFATLEHLIVRYRQLLAWYGTDTGLYHLAAAMGIPATVFFGPTQPLKVVMNAQPEAAWVRLEVLANEHCEEKSCSRPLCLHQAVTEFAAAGCSTRLAETPAACPLRRHPGHALRRLRRGGR